VRIKAKCNVQIFEDANGENALLSGKDELAEVILDGPQEANVIKADLLALGVFSVPLGSVGTPTGLFLKSTGDFDLVLNGGTPLQVRREVRAATGGAKAASAKFYFEGVLASATITALTDAITVTGALWGDPAV
jgi:hypothetical protein